MRWFVIISICIMAIAAMADEPDKPTAQQLYISAMQTEAQGDTIAAFSIYKQAAEAGYLPAQNYLGFCYYHGYGVERDPHMALQWIEKAAKGGDPKACNNLGFLLAEGDKVVRDYRKAAYWLGKATEQGLPVAQSQLADLYRNGHGVEADTLKARQLYQQAITGGLKDAERKLLAMDYDSYRLLSAEQATQLGREYYRIKAFYIAATLFEIAAEANDAVALLFLGECYSLGRGVPYDYQKSLDYYYRSALAGAPTAQFIVGETLEITPDAFPNDPHGAQYWLQKAAQQGVIDSTSASQFMWK